jgi:hypothetical protein
LKETSDATVKFPATYKLALKETSLPTNKFLLIFVIPEISNAKKELVKGRFIARFPRIPTFVVIT